MNTSITAQLNDIRHAELLREAEHVRLAAQVADHPEARNFRLVPRRLRRATSPAVTVRAA